VADQVADALDGQVEGQGEERHADQPDGTGLAFFGAFPGAQLPDHDGGGEELDDGVQAEPDEGD